MTGFNVESTTDVTIGEYAGKAVVLTNSVAAGAACRFGPMVSVFTYLGGTAQGMATNPGLIERFSVIDVAGTPVILTGLPGDVSSTVAATFDQTYQSIDFED
jgi:hypothetical protein